MIILRPLYRLFSSAVEQLIRNEQVEGSNPLRGSKEEIPGSVFQILSGTN